jgi:hypothetical protein
LIIEQTFLRFTTGNASKYLGKCTSFWDGILAGLFFNRTFEQVPFCGSQQNELLLKMHLT